MKSKKPVSAFAVLKTREVRRISNNKKRKSNSPQIQNNLSKKMKNKEVLENLKRQVHAQLDKSPMVYRPKPRDKQPKENKFSSEVEKKFKEANNNTKPINGHKRRRSSIKKNINIENDNMDSFTVEQGGVSKTILSKSTEVEKVENDSISLFDSRHEAKKCFSWLIFPVTPDNFFKDVWEKTPLLVKRHHNSTYYKRIFSTDEFDRILKEQVVQFGKNIDVTSYVDGKRETHNPEGRAHASVVWDYYQNGCSIRLLNPQTFSKSVWNLTSFLQEYFGSCVGANVYLTPPGTQGFAPHYDDIEAFVLQLEGKKRWKLYAPRNPSETLPRHSSSNLNPKELGENILTVQLEPGDMLYFPRGFIHQASTQGDAHSLHITVSAAQQNTWGDFLQKLVPTALEQLFEDDQEFRESLPIDYMKNMGVANSDILSEGREKFLEKLQNLMNKLISNLPVDPCVDQIAKKYVHDCLPPVLNKAERKVTIIGNQSKWDNGAIVNQFKLENKTQIKLIRSTILRLVTEENVVRVYHSMENSREYHGEEPQFMEILPDMAIGVEYLIHSYPNFIAIDELPVEKDDDRMTLAAALYEKGLVMTKEPLN
uniref:Bifunctional lysine-specific demethylase and histidyl-hydroxylase n=1 Tax=Strigamia maritima TaxID=126957 RepID=T1J5W2_STRMM